jgi:N-acylglucosamine-6-phosphate 2-epimerase
MLALDQMRGGLVVSCQPIDGGAMDRPDIVAAMAMAAVEGGAVGVRIEGIANVKAARERIGVPIIGLIKRDLPTTAVRITPFAADALALIEAGADIIAYDATDRARPEPREAVLSAILSANRIAMADCATVDDARAALFGGASIIGTTLSGYTAATTRPDNNPNSDPDLALVRAFAPLGGFVMAEGRFNTPSLAAAAIAAGAHAVTVGSALTRLEWMVSRFAAALGKGSP